MTTPDDFAWVVIVAAGFWMLGYMAGEWGREK